MATQAIGSISSNNRLVEYGVFSTTDTSTNINSATAAVVPIDTSDYTDPVWSLASNQITLTDTFGGIQLVEISVCVGLISAGTARTQPRFRIRKNGTTFLPAYDEMTYARRDAGENDQSTVNFTVMDTSPANGDDYELISDQSDGAGGSITMLASSNQLIFRGIR
jgi:hypothetical protein